MNAAGSVAPEPITARPPHPVVRPVMLQGWHHLTALHWRYEPGVVQALLPDGYGVDTFDGSAWVGLIPFEMSRVRVPGLPAFGRLSTFPETNVRTYIVDAAGRRAVWFFSLDVSRLIPALVARVTYRLPYCWARMSIAGVGAPGGLVEYRSSRRWPGGEATSRVTVLIGEPLGDDQLTPLDHFLTARWALGSTLGGRLLWAPVDHAPWPLSAAEVIEWDETLIAAAGLPAPHGAPIARWSPGVEVRIGRPSLIPRRPRGR